MPASEQRFKAFEGRPDCDRHHKDDSEAENDANIDKFAPFPPPNAFIQIGDGVAGPPKNWGMTAWDTVNPGPATAAATAAAMRDEFRQVDGAVPGSSTSGHSSPAWINADAPISWVRAPAYVEPVDRLHPSSEEGEDAAVEERSPQHEDINDSDTDNDSESETTDDEEGRFANAEARRRLLADIGEDEEVEEEEEEEFLYDMEGVDDGDDDDLQLPSMSESSDVGE